MSGGPPIRHRLSEFRGTEWEPVRYGNVFHRFHWSEGTECLLVAPETDPLQLLLQLARSISQDFYLLWVLHTPRGGSNAGRYQSPLLPLAEVAAFLHEHRELLAEDGRQDLWLHSPKPVATLVWDRHEVLYLYGPLSGFETQLLHAGLRHGESAIPAPHAHNYHPELDENERALAAALEWKISPLRARDEQGRNPIPP